MPGSLLKVLEVSTMGPFQERFLGGCLKNRDPRAFPGVGWLYQAGLGETAAVAPGHLLPCDLVGASLQGAICPALRLR